MVNYSDNGSFSESSSSLYGSSLGFGPISNISSNNFALTTFGGGINPVTSSTGGLIFGGNSDDLRGASSLQTSSMSTSTLTFGATSPIVRSSFSPYSPSPSSPSLGISIPAFSESNASNQNSQKAFQQTPVAPVDFATNSSNESASCAVLCGNCCAHRSQLISSAMSLPRGTSTVGYIDATDVTSNSGFPLSTAVASAVSGTSSYGVSNTSIAGYSCPVQSFCQSASSFCDRTLPGNTTFGLQPTATLSTKNSAATAFSYPHGQSQVDPYTVTLDKDETNSTVVFPSALISISAMPVYKDKSHEELRSEYNQGLCSKPVGIWNQFASAKTTLSNRGTQWCSTNSPTDLTWPGFSNKLGERRTGGFIASSDGGVSCKFGEIRTSGFLSIPGGIELEKINSVCSIPVYSSKSHEELRFEHHKSGAWKPANQFAVARNSFVNPLCPPTHSNLLTPQGQNSCPSETSFFRFPPSDASAKSSNFINSELPSFVAPFTTGSSTVSQNSFSFFSPSSPSVPQSQIFSFPLIAPSTIESNFTESGIKSSANSSSTESSSVCPNSFSFFTPSAPSVPEMLTFSFPVTTSASTSNFTNYVAPSSASPFSTVSSVPRSQLFSFPPSGTESNFTNSGVTSLANSFQAVSSSICPVSFSVCCPSSPSVPQTQPVSFPNTVTLASTSNFTNSEIPSFANPFSTISSTMCPNSFSFFNPSSPSVPQTQPSSFLGTEASISASNITSAGVPSSAKSFLPFEYSLPWKHTSYCAPAGPFTRPNISGEASTKGGFFNLFASAQSCADNSAKCSQRKASFVASPPTLSPDFGDAASAGIFNQQSAGLRDSKIASQSCYQSINGQESVSVGAEVDLSSTISSPFSVSGDAANESSEREGPSIHVYMNSETSNNRVGESLAVRPSLKTNGGNSDINPRFCVTIRSERKGEVSVVVGGNQNITKIMPNIQSADYYTIPPIEELAAREKSEPGFCGHVKDFVVGRRGYGSIKFLGETDVREHDLEALIKFNYREVIVFMDESKKPPIGQGLNKAAEITLLGVKCINKYTGIPYVDGPPVEAYREMLKDKVAELHGEMVSYDPALGEWKFKVQHF